MNPLIIAGKDLAWHSIRRTFSVITTLLAIGGLGWAVYAGIIRPTTKPNPTTTQKAQIIQNVEINNPEDTFFIGVKIFGFKLGLSKPTIKTARQAVKEVAK